VTHPLRTRAGFAILELDINRWVLRCVVGEEVVGIKNTLIFIDYSTNFGWGRCTGDAHRLYKWLALDGGFGRPPPETVGSPSFSSRRIYAPGSTATPPLSLRSSFFADLRLPSPSHRCHDDPHHYSLPSSQHVVRPLRASRSFIPIVPPSVCLFHNSAVHGLP
jgi:hypothetical protein